MEDLEFKLRELITKIRKEIKPLKEVEKHSKKYPKTVALTEHGYGRLMTLEQVEEELDKIIEV